jgi:hypothetical protein
MAREWVFHGKQFNYGPRDRMGTVMVAVYDTYVECRRLTVERVRRYSCSGICWGSDSGGYRDVAIMILRSHFQLSGMEQRAVALADAHHEAFCREVVANLKDTFVLAGCEIEEWYRKRIEQAA